MGVPLKASTTLMAVAAVVAAPHAARADRLALMPLAAPSLDDASRTALEKHLHDVAAHHLPVGWELWRDADGRAFPAAVPGCAGEPTCVVTVLRAAGADWGVAGEVTARGNQLLLELALHDARSGVVLRSTHVGATGVARLVGALPPAVRRLLGAPPERAAPILAPGEPRFEFTRLGAVREALPPPELDPTVPVVSLDEAELAALEAYDRAARVDAGDGRPSAKTLAWRELAVSTPRFARLAEARAAEWDRYSRELVRAEAARRGRGAARDRDGRRLTRLLRLAVVSDDDKRRWAEGFMDAYGEDAAVNPWVPQLRQLLAASDPYGPIDDSYDAIDAP